MSDTQYAVIMAGGRGERFWPLSTSRTPKQLLSLVGGKPLIGLAVDRLKGVMPLDHVFIVTADDLIDATREAVPDLPPENVVGEPFGRNTAPACALGCALVKARCPSGVLAVLTADHIITDLDIFHATLNDGFRLAAENDVLITIGINPDSASTGFGYIEAGDSFEDVPGKIKFFQAKRFVEKPDKETAQSYLAAGNFFWNSGMFIWSVNAFESAVEKHHPELKEMMDCLVPAVGTPEFSVRLKSEYDKIENISVDYAIMEKATNILTARGEFTWDDVGSWPALENHFDADENGNIVIGESRSVDSNNNIIVAGDRMTALVGVKDLVVVQAEGATLVCHRDMAQKVKTIVTMLRETGGHDHLL